MATQDCTLSRPQSAPVVTGSSRPWIGLRLFLLPLATAGLLWACYFPLDWGWLAWVALAPLLLLVRVPGRRRGLYLSAWVGGLMLYLTSMQWMRVADDRMYATWIGLALY